MNATQNRCDNSFIFSLLMILLFVLIPATSRADIQCYQCHGTSTGSDYRPIDAVSRNYSSGGFMGNHRSHMAAPASPITCRKCHNNQDYTSNHRNGFINFSSNINSSPLKGKYLIGGSPVTSKAQNVTPVLGTCTDVNCHFEAVTRQWGTELFTAPTDCDKCHGAPPNGGATGAVGSHYKHDQYYSGVANCQKCHSNNTTFQHATSAGKRNLNISFAAAPNNGGGAYSGLLNDYLPSQNLSGTGGFGSCTATYCHSPGNKASDFDQPTVVPEWGGTALTCKGCHKEYYDGVSNISSGSHSGHVYSWAGMGARLTCVKCHAATTTINMSISDTSRHVDGLVTIAFNNSSSAISGRYNGTLATPGSPMSKTPGSAPATCSIIYCHSTAQGNGGTWPPTYRTPTWGSAATGSCGTCHGVNTRHGGTVFSIGSSTTLASGSHEKHLNYSLGFNASGVKCAACHSNLLNSGASSLTGCNNGACHSVPNKHPNYEINVGIPAYFGASAAYSGTTRPGDGYGFCAAVYCHSNGLATSPTYATPSPTWGNLASGACGTCHGVTAAAPPSSTSHIKHVGIAYPYIINCSACHSGKVQITANSTIQPAYTNLTSHVNKSRDVKFNSISPFGTYSTVTLSCRNLYCHSIGNLNVTAGALPAAYNSNKYSRQSWSGSLSCNGCHGRSNEDGQPDYTNGGPGATTANSHSKHLSLGDISCSECHRRTTTDGTTIRVDVAPSSHVNTTTNDVFFNVSGTLSNNGIYTKATKTCTTVACHSNGRGTYQSAQWGVVANCDYCHPIASLGGSHAKHVDLSQTVSFYTYTANKSTSSGHNFGCSNCHPLSTANSHPILPIMLDFRPAVDGVGVLRSKNSSVITAYGPVGTANSGTTADSVTNSVVKCINVYCHSNGYAINTVFATTPNWYGGTFSDDKCANCHGNSPNSTIVGSAAHYSTNFMGQGVTDGHVVGIHSDTIFTGTNGLAPAGTSNLSGHGNATTATTMSCNLCHYATVTITNNDKNVVCASCHNGTQASLRSESAISNKSNHVNGIADVSFNQIKIRSKAQMVNAPVLWPYSTIWTRNNGYKNAGSYDEAKVALNTATMWDSATKTCSNVSCHNNQPVKWGSTNGTTSCQRCHPNM